MKDLNKVTKLKTILFFLAYTLIVFSDLYNNIHRLSKILQIIDVISVVLLSVVICMNFITNGFKIKKGTIFLYIFGLLVAISAYFSNDRTLVKLPFLLLAFDSIEFNDFIKKDFVIRIGLITMMIVLIATGLVHNNIVEIRGGVTRYAFGTGHPNSFALYIYSIVLDYFYIQHILKRNDKAKNIFLTIFSSIFVYIYTGSRTCMILIIVTGLLFLFKDKIKINNKISKTVICNSFLIILLFSIIFGFMFRNSISWHNLIDKLFSKRIYYSHKYLIDYSYSLFGRPLYSWQYMIIDNAYVNLFLRYGTLLTGMFVYMFNRMFNKLFEEKEFYLAIIMTVILILGFVECAIYIPAKDPFILLLALPLISRIGGVKDEKK